jgi:predicted kinase
MAALVIVTGLPATGKSVFAKNLSFRLGFPLISKDDIKEPMADSLGSGDRELSRQYGLASFNIQFVLLARCLAANISVIAETYFHGELAKSSFERLIADHSCAPVQLILRCDPETNLQRWKDRQGRGERHSIHNDEAVMAEFKGKLHEVYAGVEIHCPTVVIDTTDFATVKMDSVCEFIVGRSSHQAESGRGVS